MTGLFSRINVLCVVLGAGLLVAGCGTDDVELNGKIFDAVGLSGSQKSKGDEPKVAARSGIVVPPNTGSLPEPGSGRSVETEADLAFINDPDRKKQVDQGELARRQAEYCKANYELPKSRGDTSVDSVVGPAGPCRASILSSMKSWSGDDGAEK